MNLTNLSQVAKLNSNENFLPVGYIQILQMRLSNLAKTLDDRKCSTRETDYLVLSRVLSSFFKDLIILPKTLLPTYFKSKSLCAFHIFAMIMYGEKMNLVTFWLCGISKGFGGAPYLPSWREPWFGPPIDLTIINIMGPP